MAHHPKSISSSRLFLPLIVKAMTISGEMGSQAAHQIRRKPMPVSGVNIHCRCNQRHPLTLYGKFLSVRANQAVIISRVCLVCSSIRRQSHSAGDERPVCCAQCPCMALLISATLQLHTIFRATTFFVQHECATPLPLAWSTQ